MSEVKSKIFEIVTPKTYIFTLKFWREIIFSGTIFKNGGCTMSAKVRNRISEIVAMKPISIDANMMALRDVVLKV